MTRTLTRTLFVAATLLGFVGPASAQVLPVGPGGGGPVIHLNDPSRVYVVDFSHDIETDTLVDGPSATPYRDKRLLLHAIGTAPVPVQLTTYVLDSVGNVLGSAESTVSPGSNVSLINPHMWEILLDNNPYTNHRYTIVVSAQLPVLINAEVLIVFAHLDLVEGQALQDSGMARTHLEVYQIPCGNAGLEGYFCDNFPPTGGADR